MKKFTYIVLGILHGVQSLCVKLKICKYNLFFIASIISSFYFLFDPLVDCFFSLDLKGAYSLLHNVINSKKSEEQLSLNSICASK